MEPFWVSLEAARISWAVKTALRNLKKSCMGASRSVIWEGMVAGKPSPWGACFQVFGEIGGFVAACNVYVPKGQKPRSEFTESRRQDVDNWKSLTGNWIPLSEMRAWHI